MADQNKKSEGFKKKEDLPQKAEKLQDEFEERTVSVNRSSKTVKGGRNFSFSALVVIGDKAGRIGMGMGKANEVADAVRKAGEHARRNVVRVNMNGSTVTHPVYVKFGAAKIMIRPASLGTGVLAGKNMRPVLELAGIKDVLAKSLGSCNPVNVVKATFQALQKLRTRGEVLAKRDRSAL